MATTLPEARKLAVHCRDVVAAIRSLYLDELKPVGRLVSRRLREHAAEAVESVDVDATPTVDPQRLLQICEGSRHIHVVKVAGHDFEAYLFGQPCVFVEVDSAEDPYPDELWAELAMRFNQCWLEGVTLPGQRYLCAQVLAGCRIPCLQGRSLGQVCHIVQLSVSRRSLLGYLDDRLVPFQHSEWFMRDCGAKAGLSFAHSGLRAATMDEVRAGVWTLLHTVPEPCVLMIPMLKQLFRQSFMLDLSETSLGHSSLPDLLRDPRFSNICTLDKGAGVIRLVQQRCPLVSPAPLMPPASVMTRAPRPRYPIIHAPVVPELSDDTGLSDDTDLLSAAPSSPLAEPPDGPWPLPVPPDPEALGPAASRSLLASPQMPPSPRTPRFGARWRPKMVPDGPAPAEALPQACHSVPLLEPSFAELSGLPADVARTPVGRPASQQLQTGAESEAEEDDFDSEVAPLGSTCQAPSGRFLPNGSIGVVGMPSTWSTDDEFDVDRSGIRPFLYGSYA
uniref:OST-HTH associated domain-containing protein n=1 Tax=Zooxanthella nutricula TaxID=1333877 RepID=A0A6U6WLV0_9DINO|mmetsp:Transcript_93742/g.286829  ORF Transcript_93742/g.286829 Transcript_93742/m.286829 type:complete len:505 (+) Transcript_93742:60-1574(+)